MSAPTDPGRSVHGDLRAYVRTTLYSEQAAPISFLLPVADAVPPFDDRDVYDARISGADLREVRAAEKDQPVEDYQPNVFGGYHDPVTGAQELTIGLGYSDRDTTSAAASSAAGNAWILARQAPERRYERVVPREIVRGVAGRLCPDDQQTLRGMARLGQVDQARAKRGDVDPPRVTMKSLARDAGVTRETMHRREHGAVAALLAGLYRWHAGNPERRVA